MTRKEMFSYLNGCADGIREAKKDTVPLSVIEDIKADIKNNILDEPVEGTTMKEMAQFNSALMLSLDAIDKHIKKEIEDAKDSD